MPTVKLNLNGLTCNACIKSVTSILNSIDNVSNVLNVALTEAEVEVVDNSDASIKELIEEITDIGYEAQLTKGP